MWRCGWRLIKVLSKSVWIHLDKIFFDIVRIAIEWDEGYKEESVIWCVYASFDNYCPDEFVLSLTMIVSSI